MHHFQQKFTEFFFFTNLLKKDIFSEKYQNVWKINNLDPLMSIFTQIDSISYSIITKWREKLIFLYQQGRQTNYKWHWANFWHEDSSKAPSHYRLSKIFPFFIFRLQGFFIVPLFCISKSRLPEKVTNMHHFQPKFTENHFFLTNLLKKHIFRKIKKCMRNQQLASSYVYFYTNWLYILLFNYEVKRKTDFSVSAG